MTSTTSTSTTSTSTTSTTTTSNTSTTTSNTTADLDPLSSSAGQLLAWEHLGLIFDEIKAAHGKVSNNQLLELNSLNNDLAVSLQILARNNVIHRGSDKSLIVLDPNTYEVLPNNLHCNCTNFAASVYRSSSSSSVACVHHIAARLYLATTNR